jgi:hypothetical protein
MFLMHSHVHVWDVAGEVIMAEPIVVDLRREEEKPTASYLSLIDGARVPTPDIWHYRRLLAQAMNTALKRHRRQTPVDVPQISSH